MSASHTEIVSPSRDILPTNASASVASPVTSTSLAASSSSHPSFENELTLIQQQIAALQPKIDAAERRRDARPEGDILWLEYHAELKQLRTKEALLLRKEEQLRDELKRKELTLKHINATSPVSHDSFDITSLRLALREDMKHEIQPIKDETRANRDETRKLRESQQQLQLENQRLQMGQQRALAEVRSSRRTTEQWADMVLNAPRDMKTQATMAPIDEDTILNMWINCQSERTHMKVVICEDSKGKDTHDVQSVITSTAIKCCQGGPLCYRDTHRSCYPSNHMIDGSFVTANSPCAVDDSRVTFGELVAFGEYKFDLQQESTRRGAAIQCNDRVYEMKDASSVRQFAVFFIADKLDIRFFRWDRDTEEFVSTDSLPFLRDQQLPTSGFSLFYRFCQSTPSQLGAPDPPVHPALTDKYKFFLLRNGAGIKANVYRAQSKDGNFICKHFPSRKHYEREASALRRVTTHTVPIIVEDHPDLLALILKPCGITLREAEFDVQLLKNVASSCVDALKNAHSLQPSLFHFDPSPDNIIVWWDIDGSEKVCLNDWGSASHIGHISSTAGTNPIYRCSELGYTFEMAGSEFAEFDYTPLSDLRALFISLLAFCVHPRKHVDMELPGLLPWERVGIADLQKTKRAMLRDQKDFWKDFRPETPLLLGALRSLLFQQQKDDTPSLESVYMAFKNLGPHIHTIDENERVMMVGTPIMDGEVHSADAASSTSLNTRIAFGLSHSSSSDPTACGCGVGTQSNDACKSNSRCRCVRSLPIGQTCGSSCKCADKCCNPHNVSNIMHL